jgi:hypothetical protein
MLINSNQADKRLASPMNLFNKIRRGEIQASPVLSSRKQAMSLFVRPASPEEPKVIEFNPFSSADNKQEVKEAEVIPEKQEDLSSNTLLSKLENLVNPIEQPSVDRLIENHDQQVKLALAHDNALSLLNKSVEMLDTKLDDIKADKLPAVISAASKVVEGIRKERLEQSKIGKDRDVHFHFYTPQQKSLDQFKTIEVSS